MNTTQKIKTNFLLLLKEFNMLIKNIKLWISIPAVTFGVLIAMWYIKNVDFTLRRFTDRIIGGVIFYGVDPAKRQDVYFISMFIFILVFAFVAVLLSLFNKTIYRKSVEQYFKSDKTILLELSFLLLINLSLAVKNFNDNAKTIVILLFAIFALVSFSVLKFILLLRNHENASLLFISKPEFTFYAIFTPVPLLYFYQLFFGTVINIFTPVNGVIYVLLFLLFAITMRYLPPKYLDSNRIALSLIPLSLIPVSIIAANETQYTLAKYFVTSPVVIALIFSAVLITASFLIYLFGKHNVKTNASKIISNVLFPVILVTLVIYSYHLQLYIATDYEMHLANIIVPIQQLFQFGKIPFLDLWSVHQHLPVGGLLYSLFNGLNQLEPIVWHEFFDIGITVFVFYFVLKVIFPSRFVFLSFLFLPIYNLFSGYYALALLPIAYMRIFINNKKLKNYIIFLLFTFIPFIWMPTAGKISVISGIILLIVSCKSKDDIFKILKSFAIVFGIPAFMYCILTLLRGESIIDKFVLIKAFASVDFNVGGYTSIIRDDNPLWEIILTYGFAPILALVIILYIFTRNSKSYRDYAVLFMAVASLIEKIRSLARHSLVESFSLHFGLLLLLFFVFYIKKASKNFKYISFIIITSFCIIFIPNVNGSIFIEGIKSFELKKYRTGETRYVPNEEYLPNNLMFFMKNYLRKGQTYFDMSHRGLTYALTQKEMPFFHIDNQIIFPESAQQVYIKQFEKKYKENKIPIVIFTDQWGTSITHLPPVFSLFKLSESIIYKYYKPWIIVDGYQLWLANNSHIVIPEIDYSNFSFQSDNGTPQNFYLINLPFIWANYDKKTLKKKQETLKELGRNIIISNMARINFTDNIDKRDGNYVYLRVKSERSGEQLMRLSYGGNNSFIFNVFGGTHEYLIRISSQYYWMNENINEFVIDTTNPMVIERISILRGD